jgi:hypothetical protein
MHYSPQIEDHQTGRLSACRPSNTATESCVSVCNYSVQQVILKTCEFYYYASNGTRLKFQCFYCFNVTFIVNFVTRIEPSWKHFDELFNRNWQQYGENQLQRRRSFNKIGTRKPNVVRGMDSSGSGKTPVVLVNTVMNLQNSSNAGNFWCSWTNVTSTQCHRVS